MFRPLICLLPLALLAACASPQAPKPAPLAPDAFIKVAAGPCYFRCSQFNIVVRPDGGYALDNIADTRKDGKSEGRFGPDVWAQAVAAFDEAKFDTLNDVVTMEPGGSPCISDAPSVTVTRHFTAGDEKSVRWYLGCRSKPLSTLTGKLNELFQYKTLVAQDN